MVSLEFAVALHVEETVRLVDFAVSLRDLCPNEARQRLNILFIFLLGFLDGFKSLFGEFVLDGLEVHHCVHAWRGVLVSFKQDRRALYKFD